MHEHILGLVPARSGSKGIKNKNIRSMLGKPLLAWAIETLKGVIEVDRVVLSTDSEQYAEIGRRYGAEVPFLRAEHLANDTASSIDVVLDAWDKVFGPRADGTVVLLEPTSPLTSAEDIQQGISLLQQTEGARSIVTVAEVTASHPRFMVHRSDAGFICPYMLNDQAHPPRRQETEPLYYYDGSFYISTIEALRQTGTFYHDSTLSMVMPRWKSFEIDDEEDWQVVETLLSTRRQP